MAIVPNLALQGGPNPGSTTNIDPSYASYSRAVAGAPPGVTTPAFAGEIVLDTVGASLWKAMGVVNTTWVPYVNDD